MRKIFLSIRGNIQIWMALVISYLLGFFWLGHETIIWSLEYGSLLGFVFLASQVLRRLGNIIPTTLLISGFVSVLGSLWFRSQDWYQSCVDCNHVIAWQNSASFTRLSWQGQARAYLEIGLALAVLIIGLAISYLLIRANKSKAGWLTLSAVVLISIILFFELCASDYWYSALWADRIGVFYWKAHVREFACLLFGGLNVLMVFALVKKGNK